MALKLGQRKVSQLNYSLIVCIPKIWLRQFGLGKGDYLSVEISRNNDLVLKPILTTKNKEL